MLKLHPDLVRLENAIDHPPPQFPPYDVYPPHEDWTPATGTLSSPVEATAEKGALLLRSAPPGSSTALKKEFGDRSSGKRGGYSRAIEPARRLTCQIKPTTTAGAHC